MTEMGLKRQVVTAALGKRSRTIECRKRARRRHIPNLINGLLSDEEQTQDKTQPPHYGLGAEIRDHEYAAQSI